MKKHCDKCGTAIEIDEEYVDMGKGKLLCGTCADEMNARDLIEYMGYEFEYADDGRYE